MPTNLTNNFPRLPRLYFLEEIENMNRPTTSNNTELVLKRKYLGVPVVAVENESE